MNMHTNVQQQESRQVSPIQQFRQSLEGNMRLEIAKALPKGVDPDRFIRTTITTVQMNPDLLQANRSSLFAACMQAAKDGLLPDGKEATIQIYKTKVRGPNGDQWVQMAQYMPMVRGLVNKMYDAGCTKVDAAAVYEKDHFRYLRGDDDRLEHEPYMGDEDPGKVVAAYAIVKLQSGEVKREVMPRRDIEKVRGVSKAASGPGWTTWYDQFAIKAVLKRIYKQLPHRNLELERLFDSDNEALGIEFDATERDVTPAPRQIEHQHQPRITGRSSRLDQIMGTGMKAEAVTEPTPQQEGAHGQDEQE